MQHREKTLQHWVNIARSCWNRLIIRKGLKHNWIKISILACLCFIFYTFSARHMPKKLYKTEDLLGPAYSLIKNNGKLYIDGIPSLSYYADDVKNRAMNDLRHLVQELVKTCTSSDKTGCESERRYLAGSAVLTLFTTWIYDKDKFYINNNTLYNWKKLRNVKLVIFSDDTEVVYFGKQAGWEILPVTKQAADAPVLPVMFQEVMSKFSSEFYGYANGDLLFTESLTKTLEAILCRLTSKAKSQGTLVVGKRVNVPSAIINEVPLTLDALEQLATKHGSLFQADAEDYFLTNRNFPWSSFLPVAVGRTGYDNWVVTYARLKNVTVIDATDTILCIHQTMESRGNYEGHSKGDFNVEMIESLNLPIPVFSWGQTSCAGMKTGYELCNNVLLMERSSLPDGCTSYYWSHKFLRVFGLANNTVNL